MQTKKFTTELGGVELTAEFSDLAENAHGSVLLRYGQSVVLATAVMSKGEKDLDYFPLSVEYEERFYAAGQILGSRFQRREGRPSDEAILSGRIVDRTIRPLFNHNLRNEVQVIITTLSLGEYDPDILGVIGASLALGTSFIPWGGPVGAVRVGKKVGEEKFLINPTYDLRQAEDYELDVIACGKDNTINMIEVGSKEVSEEVLNKALEAANEELKKLQQFQERVIKEIGQPKKEVKNPEIDPELKKLFETEIVSKIDTILGEPGKKKIYDLEDEWFALIDAKMPEADHKIARQMYHEAVNDFVHDLTLKQNKRIDGRGFDELRQLYAQAGGISSIIHGTGVFYRGGTHILSALTLGAPGDSQVIDGMELQTNKRFMHHYNFPPFSTGEVGRVGSTNRRMIGHGALAEKALTPLIPAKETFPYTIRIVSEALSSNGSTSMGSVCGSSLALMDAGVPIKKHVAGIASGLMSKGDQFKVLTDIQGPEDEHGDMDFKVAGTRDGVTAVQMDVKVDGIPLHVLKEAFEKARLARYKILDVLEAAIPAPRADLSPNAPRIFVMTIRPDQIGMVIGTGGKVINEIKEKTGVEIDIEDDGTVYITGEAQGAQDARASIEAIVHEFKKGDKTVGEVVRIAEFGAIVKLNKNDDGLVHVSEIAPFRIDKVENYLKIGMQVPIVVKDVDDKGRLKLSIKDADPNFVQKKTV